MKISHLIETIKSQYRQPPERRRPIFAQGVPGVGKSMAAETAAADLGIGFMALQATIEDPITLSGLPARAMRVNDLGEAAPLDYAVFLPFADKLPTSGEGILCVDEINCFPPGTPVTVATPAGDLAVPIEAVHVGDQIVCTDLDTRERRVKPCLGVVRYGPKERLVRIKTDDGRELAATANHHVYTERGWVAIAALRQGDRLYSLSALWHADGRDNGAALGRSAQHLDRGFSGDVSRHAHAAPRDEAGRECASRGNDSGFSRKAGGPPKAYPWGIGAFGEPAAREIGVGGPQGGQDDAAEIHPRGTSGIFAQGRAGGVGDTPGAIRSDGREIGRVLELAAGESTGLGTSEAHVEQAGAQGEYDGKNETGRRGWADTPEISRAAHPSRMQDDRLYRPGEAAVAVCGGRRISDRDIRRPSAMAEPGFSCDRPAQGGVAGFAVPRGSRGPRGDGLSPSRLDRTSGFDARVDGRALVEAETPHVHLVRVVGIRTEPYAGFVYDLTVEGEHNYFANGYLVHNTAPPAVQAGLYDLFLHGHLGSYRIPPGWYVMATGNRDEDRAATQRIPMPLIGRWTRVMVEVDLADWTKWALVNDVRTELIAFFQFRPELFHTFDPKKPEPYCCPRTAVFASHIIESAPFGLEHELLCGTVGEGVATELSAFMRIFREMVSVDQILLDPQGTPVPKEPAAACAIAAALAHKATVGNIDRVLTFGRRMLKEYEVLIVSLATKRDMTICASRAFIQWASDNTDIVL